MNNNHKQNNKKQHEQHKTTNIYIYKLNKTKTNRTNKNK